jgi:hypothetical protein
VTSSGRLSEVVWWVTEALVSHERGVVASAIVCLFVIVSSLCRTPVVGYVRKVLFRFRINLT